MTVTKLKVFRQHILQQYIFSGLNCSKPKKISAKNSGKKSQPLEGWRNFMSMKIFFNAVTGLEYNDIQRGWTYGNQSIRKGA
jgi:hypothetical protein